MAVRLIWDISLELFFSSILKSTQASARVISKLIKNNKGDIYSKSHEQACDSWLITFSLINTAKSYPEHQIYRVITKQRADYKTEEWFGNDLLTSHVGLHAKMWLYLLIKCFFSQFCKNLHKCRAGNFKQTEVNIYLNLTRKIDN